MKATTHEGNGTVSPPVHLEFIQNAAGVQDGEGIEGVEAYHRAVFLHHHAKDFEQFHQQGRIHEERVAHLETRLKDAHEKLARTDKLIPVCVDGEADDKPTAPWNIWDRAMFTAALLGIAVLLVFGMLNISFNLLESGLVTFIESPLRAYFWAALLPVGALAVKVGWDLLQNRRARALYLWVCLALGIVGVLVWVGAYATVYPALSRTTAEQIASLSVFDEGAIAPAGTSSGVKWVDVTIVSSQAVAEIFLSAVLGMYMTMIYLRHRPVRLAENPLFTQLNEERRALEENVARERLALAEAKGNENRLTNQLTAFVSYAKSVFQKEASLRQDQDHQKRILLDQISEQLRKQLQIVENGGSGERNFNRPAVENGQTSGR